MTWEQDRRDELGELVYMLVELRSINNGSGFIEKLQECIEVAEKLTTFDIDSPRKDFCQYLVELATDGLDQEEIE